MPVYCSCTQCARKPSLSIVGIPRNIRRNVYTIKQDAQRSGVSVPLLRAWERRYGIVEPARTASGYRLYDDSAIARLRAMRALVDDGWAPSTASVRVLESNDETIAELAASPRPSIDRSRGRTASSAGSSGSDAGPDRNESGEPRAADARTATTP